MSCFIIPYAEDNMVKFLAKINKLMKWKPKNPCLSYWKEDIVVCNKLLNFKIIHCFNKRENIYWYIQG